MSKLNKVFVAKKINSEGVWEYVYRYEANIKLREEAVLSLRSLLGEQKKTEALLVDDEVKDKEVWVKLNNISESISKYKQQYVDANTKDITEIGEAATFVEKYLSGW